MTVSCTVVVDTLDACPCGRIQQVRLDTVLDAACWRRCDCTFRTSSDDWSALSCRFLMLRHTRVVQDAHGNEYNLPPSQALARQGPVVSVSLRPLEEQRQAMVKHGEVVPATVDGLALIDTGASCTCVDQSAANRAGLTVIDRGTISSASHSAHSVPYSPAKSRLRLGTDPSSEGNGSHTRESRTARCYWTGCAGSTILIYNGPNGSFSISLEAWCLVSVRSHP